MHGIQPPGWKELVGESRTVFQLIRLIQKAPELARAPRGRGRPVLVLPGFGTSDRATFVLRNYLSRLDYRVAGWGLGINRGNVPELLGQVSDLVAKTAARFGQPVRLVGWSLGGYLAREAARTNPQAVASVITLGTPVIGGPKYTAMARYYARRGFDLDRIAAEVEARYTIPLQVPVTALYTRKDGVVSWRACIDDKTDGVEHVEVSGTHLGLAINPEVLRIVADRLAYGPRGGSATP